jgi:predicted small secreted protein
MIRNVKMLAALLVLTAPALAACNKTENIVGPDPNRVYAQIERLGNPLVSEVFLAKRDHGFFNIGMPSSDVTTFKTKLEDFVRLVGGRNTTVQTTLSTVLLPDMLIVQTDKASSTAGWLTWALANGYGGRKLADDVVDAGLAAIFGSLLDPSNTTPALTSDNVGASVRTFATTFPYLNLTN